MRMTLATVLLAAVAPGAAAQSLVLKANMDVLRCGLPDAGARLAPAGTSTIRALVCRVSQRSRASGERKPSMARTQGAGIAALLRRPRTKPGEGLQPPERDERWLTRH